MIEELIELILPDAIHFDCVSDVNHLREIAAGAPPQNASWNWLVIFLKTVTCPRTLSTGLSTC